MKVVKNTLTFDNSDSDTETTMMVQTILETETRRSFTVTNEHGTQDTEGFSLGVSVSAEVSVGVPFIGGGSVSTTASMDSRYDHTVIDMNMNSEENGKTDRVRQQMASLLLIPVLSRILLIKGLTRLERHTP
jgi:hypothetical protein